MIYPRVDVSIYADVSRGHRYEITMLHFKSKEGIESFAMLDTPVLGRFEFNSIDPDLSNIESPLPHWNRNGIS